MRLMKARTPDILHTHKYKDNILGCLAAIAAGVPKVVRVVHGMTEPFSGIQYVRMGAYEMLDGLFLRSKASKLIAVSSNIESQLVKKYGSDRVVCIHNGIDLNKVTIKQRREDIRGQFGVAPDRYLIGTVGRLTAIKGHETLLRAASLALRGIKPMQYLIVGDGPLMTSLKALAGQLGIEKQVIFAGHRENVYDLIQSMDAFVLPSLHEGIPMVLLEALALCRPVVASRVGGVPEVIEHGANGLLVEPGNPEELGAALSILMQEPSLADRLGRCGRSRIEQEYSATLMVRRTAELYSALAS
jgi:glycosyltransferase involved in cell wall biosynthesis